MTVFRKASMRDVPHLLTLINGYASQGIMLPRTEFELAEGIRDFTVGVDEHDLPVACAALHFYTPAAAEVRSLAVHPGLKGRGIGRDLVKTLEKEANQIGISNLFAFTYVPGFFAQLGYDQVDRGLLPQKAWKDCLRCPKFQNCDEIAVYKKINNRDIELDRRTPTLKVLELEAAQVPVTMIPKS